MAISLGILTQHFQIYPCGGRFTWLQLFGLLAWLEPWIALAKICQAVDVTWPDLTWRDMGPAWRVSGRPTGRSNRSNCPADGSGGCHADRALSVDPGACYAGACYAGACYAGANGWLSNRTMVEQCPKQCLTISQRRQRGEGQRWEPRDPK